MKNSIKNLVITTLAASAIMCAPVFAQQNVSVQVDGIPLETDVPAQIIDGRTMVPMRAIFEALGTEIEWDADTKTVTASQGNANIVMQVGSKEFTVLGAKNTLDVPPCIIDGRTLVPVRAVSESFECEVNWSAEEKLVSIITLAYDAEKPETMQTDENKNTENADENNQVNNNSEASVSYYDPKAVFLDENAAPKPIDYSNMDEMQKKLHQDARYAFEQTYLAQSLFGTESYKELAVNSSWEFAKSIGDIWNNAVSKTIVENMIESETEYVIDSEETLYNYVEQQKNDCCLNASENIGSIYWSKDGETYVLLEFADDSYLTACRYIMISCTQAEGFRIRTMEKSLNGADAFCEIEKDGRHTDTVVQSTNKKADFLNYIFG